MRMKSSVLVLALLALGGCGLFGQRQPALVAKEFVSPYSGMPDKSVAILIYTPAATLDEYPGAREEISNFVATQMREHLGTTKLLAPQDVIYWQTSTLNWQNLSPSDIARKFSVDRLLIIEVLDYSTKRPLGVSTLQGRLRAQCKIYETQDAAPAADGRQAAAWTGLIDAVWPPTKALDPTQTNESAVRLRTLESFADRLVRCFYELREGGPSIRG